MKTLNDLLLAHLAKMALLGAVLAGGCSAMNSTNTPNGRSKGLTPMQDVAVGDKTRGMTPFPAQAAEIGSASIFSQFPFSIIPTPLGPWMIGQGTMAKGIEFDVNGKWIRIGEISTESASTLSAISGELEALAKAYEALGDAQARRDETQADVAIAAIAASVKALVKIALGL